MSPTADAGLEQRGTRVDLSSLEPGVLLRLTHVQTPIAVLRLTPEQISTAQITSHEDLLDPFAQNSLMMPDAPASFENHTIDADGTFVVLNTLCDGFGYVALDWESSDGSFWFCPRGAERFDVLGRLTSYGGSRTTNLQIPPYVFSAENELVILDQWLTVSDTDLDRLLYGAAD